MNTNTNNYSLTNKISPCKDCKDRYVGCHGTCSRYNNWNNTRLEEKEKIINMKDQESLIIGYEINRARKIAKTMKTS